MKARELLREVAASLRGFGSVNELMADRLVALADRMDAEEAQMPTRWDGGATAKMLDSLDADL